MKLIGIDEFLFKNTKKKTMHMNWYLLYESLISTCKYPNSFTIQMGSIADDLAVDSFRNFLCLLTKIA